MWLAKAMAERGIKELTGSAHSERIIEYHRHTSLGATDDETPWCSSFLCWLFETLDITSPKSAASLSWLRWGKVLDTPRRGCVVILERLDANGDVIPNRGHCGLWVGATDTTVQILGGNQRNKVGVNDFPIQRVVGYRWPSKPMNSTTNMATVVVGTGSAVAAAPTVISSLTVLNENKDAVQEVRGFVETLVANPTGAAAIGGLIVAFFGLVYICKERNEKIRRWGI